MTNTKNAAGKSASAKGTKSFGKIGIVSLIEIWIPQTPQNPPLTPKHPKNRQRWLKSAKMHYMGTNQQDQGQKTIFETVEKKVADLARNYPPLEFSLTVVEKVVR